MTVDDLARRHFLGAMLVIGLVLGAVGWKRLSRVWAEPPSDAECGELVDNYLAHAFWLKAGYLPPSDGADAAYRPPRAAEHDLDVANCRRTLTRSQVTCGVAAPNMDELERCLQ